MSPLQYQHFETPQPYGPVFQAMKTFTAERTATTPDEIWLMEHLPVFTQGQAGKAHHILNPHDIPVVQSDRGGQVTYHGPGQLMVYPLLNLRRLNLGVRETVSTFENIIVKLLAGYNITAEADDQARGVYVGGEKICSIGLRIRKGFSYHGLCLNVNLDLTPFSYINPCGYENLAVTQIAAYCPDITIPQVITDLAPLLNHEFT